MQIVVFLGDVWQILLKRHLLRRKEMIKGARKQMIVVRTGNSRYFDEAYFVLREDSQSDKRKSKDILSEANRILAEMAPDLPSTEKKQKRSWLYFCAGSLCGAVLGLIVTLLLV